MPEPPSMLRHGAGRFTTAVGFAVDRQRGSHMKLVHSTPSGRQILVVPNHSLLDTGTIRAIARQAANYLTDEEIRRVFYTE